MWLKQAIVTTIHIIRSLWGKSPELDQIIVVRAVSARRKANVEPFIFQEKPQRRHNGACLISQEPFLLGDWSEVPPERLGCVV